MLGRESLYGLLSASSMKEAEGICLLESLKVEIGVVVAYCSAALLVRGMVIASCA